MSKSGNNPSEIDWQNVKPGSIDYSQSTINSKVVYTIKADGIPLSNGTYLLFNGVIGMNDLVTTTLFGTNGKIIEQFKYDYNGFKLQDSFF